jgi:hypothetical protein
VTGLAWLGSYAFVRLWEVTQSWSLTTLMAEHSRGARLIYVPLYLILARVSVLLLAREGRGIRGWGAVVACWATVYATPHAPLVLLAVLTTAWVSRRENVRRLSWWPVVHDAVLTGGLVWPMADLVSTGRRPYAIVAIAIVLTAGARWLSATMPAKWSPVRSTAIALAVTAVLASLIAWPSTAARVVPLWRSIAPRSHATLWPAARDLIDLSAWARGASAPDSLFFFGPPTRGIASDAEFRFRAQRSITHAWKDIGIAYYSRVRLVAFHDRYYALDGARKDATKLLACTRALGADYVVLSREEHLDLPVVYWNPTYTVYRLSSQTARGSASGRWTLPSECRGAGTRLSWGGIGNPWTSVIGSAAHVSAPPRDPQVTQR